MGRHHLLIQCRVRRKDNLYFLGAYDLFQETAYKYNMVTSSVGVGSKAKTGVNAVYRENDLESHSAQRQTLKRQYISISQLTVHSDAHVH